MIERKDLVLKWIDEPQFNCEYQYTGLDGVTYGYKFRAKTEREARLVKRKDMAIEWLQKYIISLGMGQ